MCKYKDMFVKMLVKIQDKFYILRTEFALDRLLRISDIFHKTKN